MANGQDEQRAQEYRRSAARAREKAETLPNEEARQIMCRTAEIWEAMAVTLERQKGPE